VALDPFNSILPMVAQGLTRPVPAAAGWLRRFVQKIQKAVTEGQFTKIIGSRIRAGDWHGFGTKDFRSSSVSDTVFPPAPGAIT
jgi:hypothetical protein